MVLRHSIPDFADGVICLQVRFVDILGLSREDTPFLLRENQFNKLSAKN